MGKGLSSSSKFRLVLMVWNANDNDTTCSRQVTRQNVKVRQFCRGCGTLHCSHVLSPTMCDVKPRVM
jgi:hypothetical protein